MWRCCFGWFSWSTVIDSTHTELHNIPFLQAVHSEAGLWYWVYTRLCPVFVAFPLLHNVTCSSIALHHYLHGYATLCGSVTYLAGSDLTCFIDVKNARKLPPFLRGYFQVRETGHLHLKLFPPSLQCAFQVSGTELMSLSPPLLGSSFQDSDIK